MNKYIFYIINICLIQNCMVTKIIAITPYIQTIKNYHKQPLTYEIKYWACKKDTGQLAGAYTDSNGTINPTVVSINGKFCFVEDINITLQDGTKLNYHYKRDNLGGYGDHTWVIKPNKTIALIQ